MNNPFPYSFNEKRYHTFNYYLKTHYEGKVAKIILDAGFSCPNRDGLKGYGGCIFCSEAGSGDSNLSSQESLLRQYAENKRVMDRKWPNRCYIPYFQSYSNTYGPVDRIREMLKPFLTMDEVAEIAIATRCDCLDEQIVAYLAQVNTIKPLWLEIGLQTSNDECGRLLNRQYDFADFQKALQLLQDTGIRVCVHILNGLPFENKEDMLKTVKDIVHLPFHGIKIHMLHILKNTALAKMDAQYDYQLLSRDEYIELVVSQLELLPPEIVVQRLTGDPLKDELIKPDWVLNKTTILNDIDKRMVKLDTWQGKYYEQ